jgi:hypothetical protein
MGHWKGDAEPKIFGFAGQECGEFAVSRLLSVVMSRPTRAGAAEGSRKFKVRKGEKIVGRSPLASRLGQSRDSFPALRFSSDEMHPKNTLGPFEKENRVLALNFLDFCAILDRILFKISEKLKGDFISAIRQL